MCFFHPIPFGEWCKNCGEQNTPGPVPTQENADVQHYSCNQPQVKVQQRAAAQPGHIQQHRSVQPEANTQKKAIVPEQENLATQTPMLATFNSYPIPSITPILLPMGRLASMFTVNF